MRSPLNSAGIPFLPHPTSHIHHPSQQAGRDSNPQPLVLETSALPIELPT